PADDGAGPESQPLDEQAGRQQDLMNLAELHEVREWLKQAVAQSSGPGAIPADSIEQAGATLDQVQAQIAALTTRLSGEPDQTAAATGQQADPVQVDAGIASAVTNGHAAKNGHVTNGHAA